MPSHSRTRIGRSVGAFATLATLSALGISVQPAHAIHVYVMSSGNATLDAEVQALLTGHGHTSTLGPQWFQFDGTASLAGVDAVYLQMNHNWDSAPDMPHFGQVALRDWVEAGGGLVATAWSQYIVAQGSLVTLGEIFPAEPSFSGTVDTPATYQQIVPDPILNAGLPESFSFPTDDIAGTEGPIDTDPWTVFTTGPSAIAFYATQSGFYNGVLAGPAGAGWAINLSTTVGSNQIADPNFGRLVVNALVWVSSPHPPLPAAWCPCEQDPCTCAGPGDAMHVYIMSSGEPMLDAAVQTLLTSYGHTSEIGFEWWEFDGTTPLSAVDVVYLQMTYNQCHGLCSTTDMPLAGQTALRDWVMAGGGLVTTEWTLRRAAGAALDTLQTIFPAEPTTLRYSQRWVTYDETATDPILTAGLPTNFTFPVDRSGGGSVLDCLPALSRPDAIGFYDTIIGGILSNGLVAGRSGAGGVINLGTLVGPYQLADANFSRLLVNSLAWASAGDAPGCLCELDGDDAQVDVFDLLAYLDLWFAQSPDAELDGVGGVDVFDLLTFLDCWFAGC